ncbi:MAG: sensor histidine kinase N-terminal domain-containing protein [Comamonas sp.]
MLAWLRQTSLWMRLAVISIPILVVVTAVEIWITRHEIQASANAAYDRSLLGALKSIDANISTASGGLSVELPYALFELFELTASGRVSFRVATSDGLVELGSADLPVPPRPLKDGVPQFYDATYFGDEVRIAALQRLLEVTPAGAKDRRVTIQISESTKSRQEFTQRFVRSMAQRDVVVLLLLSIATAVAFKAALAPLTRLASSVESRAPDNLTPIEDDQLPAEVRPLVDAVNHHMKRTHELMVVRRQFLDDASHQLRTHLTTVQMQLDCALRESDPNGIRNALQALGEEIGVATRSTQQLLALGRSDAIALEMGAFHMQSLLREVAVLLLPQARQKGQDLGIDEPATELMGMGDQALLREALINLVANAIAYSPPDSCITMRAASDELGYRLVVEDNGPGILQADIEISAQRYRRNTRGGKHGFGLGLSIVQSIAKRHQGGLRLEAGNNQQGLLATIWWPQRPDLARSKP